MIGHYLTTAVRSLWQHRVTTALSATCLAVGLACFLSAFAVLSYYQQADRAFPNSDRHYFISHTVELLDSTTVRLMTNPWLIGTLLSTDFPDLEAVGRAGGGLTVYTEIGGQRVKVRVEGADKGFFKIFPLSSPNGGAEDQPQGALLTRASARRIFARKR